MAIIMIIIIIIYGMINKDEGDSRRTIKALKREGRMMLSEKSRVVGDSGGD